MRFKLEKLLGVGGMCEVYAALDLRRLEWSDKTPKVAVKRLLPQLADKRQAQLALAQEFFTLRHLIHPGIVRVYDLHPESNGICFSMEFLDGLSLHQSLANRPSGYGRDGIWMAAKLFETLDFLHGKGVVHADVKPANLFIAPDGRLVLIDFNISQVIVKPGAACSPISSGLRAALVFPAHSQLHASPERLKTGRPSMADDIYAACCTVYELIAGSHPFNRLSSQEAEEKGMIPQRPRGISGAQWKAVAGGLSFSAGERPSAGQLCRAFAASAISRLLTSLSG
ncbi:MAG: serine/threonine protein kinase [Desulfobulbaceae bacterium]|jgi:serine/threonine-protein kinase Stk1|nr:serine/threonine protein kinase [Desulfobulbaceae bacterium]